MDKSVGTSRCKRARNLKLVQEEEKKGSSARKVDANASRW